MGLKIIVAGKGGVGKTTVASLLSFFLSSRGKRVLALDTDSVPNLALSLGLPREMESKIVPIVKDESLVEERTGARPGESWGLLFRLNPKVDDIVDKYGIRISENLSLLVVGSIDSAKQGCLCPAISLGKALISHILMEERDVIVVDSEAGAEVFGRGLAERFDHMLCVTEPTQKSLEIAKRIVRMGRELGIGEVTYIVNKFSGDESERLRISETLDARHFFIPYDYSLIRAEIEGRSLKELDESSPAVQALRSAFESIFG